VFAGVDKNVDVAEAGAVQEVVVVLAAAVAETFDAVVDVILKAADAVISAFDVVIETNVSVVENA
jgi:phage-related holin